MDLRILKTNILKPYTKWFIILLIFFLLTDFIKGQNKSGLPWMSGVSPGTSNGEQLRKNITGFGEWRQRPVDIAAIFIGKNSWTVSYDTYLTNEVFTADGGLTAAITAGILPLLTVPLVIKADAGKFKYVAEGNIDAKHQNVANKIKSITGKNSVYLRLGHEADNGYPWSYTKHDGVGQRRREHPDVGSDEVSSEPIQRSPLTSKDVGCKF